MNLRCIVLKSRVCFFLFSCFFSFPVKSYGQASSLDTIAFYRHLKAENLLVEQVVFGKRLKNSFSMCQEGKDSLTLDLAVAYFKLMMIDSCGTNLKRISTESKFSERKKELHFITLLLSSEYEAAEKNITSLNSPIFNADARTSLSILKRQQFNPDSTEKNNSPLLLDFRSRYSKAPHYSPFLVGTFSAVLPGAGKWYIGYKKQALSSFIVNALLAAQAAESYYKAGISSPQFIITASLFGIFYSGNIWGSVLAAKKKKRDYLKQLDYEILDHYYTEFTKLAR